METKAGLTKEEYLRLLYAAKQLERERLYFIMKILCAAGVKIGELTQVTVAFLQAGGGTLVLKRTKRNVYIPEPLQTELLAFAARNGITSGPIFITRSGTPMNRTNICTDIKGLAAAANVPQEKCTPKSLWNLHNRTKKEIEAGFSALIERACVQMLCTEHPSAAWEEK